MAQSERVARSIIEAAVPKCNDPVERAARNLHIAKRKHEGASWTELEREFNLDKSIVSRILRKPEVWQAADLPDPDDIYI
mgnify:CR=1 FL=1